MNQKQNGGNLYSTAKLCGCVCTGITLAQYHLWISPRVGANSRCKFTHFMALLAVSIHSLLISYSAMDSYQQAKLKIVFVD